MTPEIDFFIGMAFTQFEQWARLLWLTCLHHEVSCKTQDLHIEDTESKGWFALEN